MEKKMYKRKFDEKKLVEYTEKVEFQTNEDFDRAMNKFISTYKFFKFAVVVKEKYNFYEFSTHSKFLTTKCLDYMKGQWVSFSLANYISNIERANMRFDLNRPFSAYAYKEEGDDIDQAYQIELKFKDATVVFGVA